MIKLINMVASNHPNMHKFTSALFVILFLISSQLTYKTTYAQKPILAPTQDRIKNVAFSNDANYLITGSDDHVVIITDLKKRRVIEAIQNVEFIEAHDKQPFFFTKRVDTGDSIKIEKRAIPSGEIIYSLAIPTKLHDGKLILSDGSTINFEDETFRYIYTEGYHGDALKQLITFSKNGQIIDSLKGLSNTKINGVLNARGVNWVISSTTLWKQKDKIFEKVLEVDPKENAFASFKVLNDTLVILSSKQIQWFDINSKKVFRTYNLSPFSTLSDPASHKMMMVQNHPFYVDKGGFVWLADTHLADANLGTARSWKVKQLQYQMAFIKDEIEYPLSSKSESSVSYQRISRDFAYHEQKQIFALLVDNHVELVDRKAGFLFSNERKNISVQDLYFTSTPGQILFTSSNSNIQPAYMLNLSNGWADVYGVVAKDLYERKVMNDHSKFLPSSERLSLFNKDENRFNDIQILQKQKDKYLVLNLIKRLEIQIKDKQVFLDDKNVLNWNDGKGNEISKLELKIKTERVMRLNFSYKKYIYNETAHLLILFYQSRIGFDVHQLWIDTEKYRVVKETEYKELVLFNDGRRYVNETGIFNIDGTLIKSFPNDRRPDLLAISKSENFIFYGISGYSKGDRLYSWEWKKNADLLLGKQESLNQMLSDPHSEMLYTLGKNGEVAIWNPVARSLIAKVLVLGQNDFKNLSEIQAGYLVLLSNGDFMASGKYNNFLSIDGVKNNFSSSYVDGAFHRPDIVLSTLGYVKNESFLKSLQSLALKRRAKFKISKAGVEVSIINKQNTPLYLQSGVLDITATIMGELKNAKTYMLYVNGTASMQFPGKPITTSVISEKVSLKDENSHVKICLVDKEGVETQGDYFYVKAPEVKKRNLYFIGMGVSNYLNKGKNLKYASKDVNDVTKFFTTNKSYHAKSFLLLNNEKAISKNVADSVSKFLKVAKEEDQVIFFFAGHGLLNKDGEYFLGTHDIDFKFPQLKGLNINDINNLLSNCKARKKMMFIDACHSGLIEDMAIADSARKPEIQKDVVVVKRGVDLADGEMLSTSSQVYFAFNQFNQGSGIDIISAAAGNEYAYEAINKIPNGVFTYNLLNGLKSAHADLNQDKIISISELQNYVAKATLMMTGGMQKPAFRQSNIYQDIPILQVADSYTGQWMEAAKRGEVVILRKLMAEENVNVDVTDDDGFSALHYASRQGNLEAVKFLMTNGAGFLKTNSGADALYLASRNGNAEITYFLLDHGASLNMFAHQIAEIVDKGNKSINEMLNDFASFKRKEEKQLNFNHLVYNNNLVIVEDQLKSKKINLNYFPITTGTSPVLIATVQKKYDMLNLLLRYGADVNHTDGTSMITALMLAAFTDDADAIKILLLAGADKNMKDAKGKTALDYAIQFKRGGAIEALK